MTAAYLIVGTVLFAAFGLTVYTETDWEYLEPKRRRRRQVIAWLSLLLAIVWFMIVITKGAP